MWIWTEEHPRQLDYECDSETRWGVNKAMDDLKPNKMSKDIGGDNQCFQVVHGAIIHDDKGKVIPPGKQWYSVDSKAYSVSLAMYLSVFKLGIPTTPHRKQELASEPQ